MFCCKCSPMIGCGGKQGSALDVVLGEGSDRQDGAPSTPAGPSLDHHSQQRREKKKEISVRKGAQTPLVVLSHRCNHIHFTLL